MTPRRWAVLIAIALAGGIAIPARAETPTPAPCVTATPTPTVWAFSTVDWSTSTSPPPAWLTASPTPSPSPSPSPFPSPSPTLSSRYFYSPYDNVSFEYYSKDRSELFFCSVSGDGQNMHCEGDFFWTETNNIVDGGGTFETGFSSNQPGPVYWHINDWYCPFPQNPLSDSSVFHGQVYLPSANSSKLLSFKCSNTASGSLFPVDTALSAHLDIDFYFADVTPTPNAPTPTPTPGASLPVCDSGFEMACTDEICFGDWYEQFLGCGDIVPDVNIPMAWINAPILLVWGDFSGIPDLHIDGIKLCVYELVFNINVFGYNPSDIVGIFGGLLLIALITQEIRS